MHLIQKFPAFLHQVHGYGALRQIILTNDTLEAVTRLQRKKCPRQPIEKKAPPNKPCDRPTPICPSKNEPCGKPNDPDKSKPKKKKCQTKTYPSFLNFTPKDVKFICAP
ncbi:PREDICTED: uncharacterized protein LOC108566131 [Nicrophorus vespilloides]|uniref:Uncharacterized protein LOC108566131 n=1 Tax=Nicrophorus vespilloides TaxID=110193 RepID=A0ABM1N3F1_NICVS|nr:PREDICTED: uncharacterized protein LOC108566131 [Nicrophorus vespilloides]